jgi:hypothetical protein
MGALFRMFSFFNVKISGEMFRRNVPAKCSGEMFRRNVPAKCSGEMFRRNVPAKCSGENFPFLRNPFDSVSDVEGQTLRCPGRRCAAPADAAALTQGQWTNQPSTMREGIWGVYTVVSIPIKYCSVTVMTA